ncbi:hypothetical protein WJX81_007707 [Elliptochloris bilobata]|uniref:Uncharacterized protein n=1 Tax=Elliptochloris bilobata TaxID=381761 RepID=A0AAW1RY99_9CHLO
MFPNNLSFPCHTAARQSWYLGPTLYPCQQHCDRAVCMPWRWPRIGAKQCKAHCLFVSFERTPDYFEWGAGTWLKSESGDKFCDCFYTDTTNLAKAHKQAAQPVQDTATAHPAQQPVAEPAESTAIVPPALQRMYESRRTASAAPAAWLRRSTRWSQSWATH